LETDTHAQDTLNPYIPDRPISDPAHFFGRKALLAWVRERLVKGDRILLLHGVRRIGKTSLLLQLPQHVPAGYLPIRLDLRKMALARDEANADAGEDSFMWAFCRSVAHEMATLHALNLSAPRRAEFARDAGYALREFLTDLRQVLGNNILLLMLDDIDALPHDGLEQRFLFDLVEQALARRPGLRFLITAHSPDSLPTGLRWTEQAPTQRLGPLTSTEAIELLKSSASGQLVYDPAAGRRAAELASGHPYYLQLLGYTLFDRCAPEVSLPDISAALEELLPLPFDEFNAWWDASSPQEQAVLALLGELKGQGGVFTFYDVHKALTRRGVHVKRNLVEQALQSLAERGVMEHLGAISYRARIELFRAWLLYHADLGQAARKARWRMRRRPASATVQEFATELTSGNRLTWAVGVAAVLVVLFLIFRLPGAAKPGSTVTPAASRLPTSTPMATTPVATELATPRLTGATATTMPVTPESTANVTLPSPTTTLSPTIPKPPGQSWLLYMHREDPNEPWQLYQMNSDGTDAHPVSGSRLGEESPAWAPHGRSVAFVSKRDDNKEIYVMNLDGTGLVNLSRDPADDWTPAWSPDSQWIGFSSFRDENWELYAVRVDGTDLIRLTDNEVSDIAPVWSPDGQTLAFCSKQDGNWDIYLMPWHGAGLTRLTEDPGNDLSPAWSPDGQWIAFESARDGDVEIYVMRADGSEPRNLTNWPYADEHGPVWSPDSQWISFYSNRDGDWDIYVMDKEGENLTNLTDDEANNQSPAWSP
jgi:Tol biopolymer transport system component